MPITEVSGTAIRLQWQRDQPVGQPSPEPLVHRCCLCREQPGFDSHRHLLILSERSPTPVGPARQVLTTSRVVLMGYQPMSSPVYRPDGYHPS